MEKEKLIFATGNTGKMKEVRMILDNPDYEILSMKEAGIELEIEEDGATFEENALIKARAVMEASGCLALADDSGLEVDFLGGEPGIYSARYMGADTSYDVKNRAIIDRLRGVEAPRRSARFVCAVAAVFPDGRTVCARGALEGQIAHEPRGDMGFGYDPIFYIPEYDKTAAQLTPEEKNRISHRGRALEAIMPELKSSGGKGTKRYAKDNDCE